MSLLIKPPLQKKFILSKFGLCYKLIYICSEKKQTKQHNKRIEKMEEKKIVSGRGVLRHLLYYVVVCGFLAFINYINSPQYWWVLWVVAGWGIAVLLQVGEWLIYRKQE